VTAHDSAAVTRMHEDDPRWLDPAQPHGLTRLQRDPDPADPGDVADLDEFGGEFGGEVWTVRRPGESWAGATVQRWCADCRAWTHVVDAGVPVDWDLDDRCASCGRGFPLDPTA
jgi:hypothetical protein